MQIWKELTSSSQDSEGSSGIIDKEGGVFWAQGTLIDEVIGGETDFTFDASDEIESGLKYIRIGDLGEKKWAYISEISNWKIGDQDKSKLSQTTEFSIFWMMNWDVTSGCRGISENCEDLKKSWL